MAQKKIKNYVFVLCEMNTKGFAVLGVFKTFKQAEDAAWEHMTFMEYCEEVEKQNVGEVTVGIQRYELDQQTFGGKPMKKISYNNGEYTVKEY